MTEPAEPAERPNRPKRPRVLIAALVALPLAAMFYAMTANRVDGTGSGLPTLALLFSLLASRFNWQRIASVVLLTLLTLQWVPGAIVYASHEGASQAASYALIGAAFFVMGVVLVFQPPSNQYYRRVADWRRERKRQRA
ncbi:hypothetical protein ACWGE0_33755 [Lentzea sp. NPDC054927]